MSAPTGASSAVTADGAPVPPEDIKAVPVRHPGRWVAVAIIAVLVAMLVNTVITNEQFRWGTVGRYVFDARVFRATLETLKLTAIAMAVAITLGVLLAVMRLSANPVVSSAAWVYLWIFRGTPVFTQLVFWGLLSALYPRLGFGIPFGPQFVDFPTQELVTPFAAAILGLALNEAAYMAEIVRSGILAVSEGQSEAAAALGMTRARTMRRIVLPQAMRVIIPPTGNELISMLKTTSLVLAVPYTLDLQFATNAISVRIFQPVPLLIVAAIWYLALTSILMVGQYYVERYYARGSQRALPMTPMQKLRMRLGGGRDGLPAPGVTAAGPGPVIEGHGGGTGDGK